MKKTYVIKKHNKEVVKVINYIPVRYIISIIIILLETIGAIAIFSYLIYQIPYFHVILFLIQIFFAIRIVNSNDNPDYKLPWLFFVMLIPIVGFMLYIIFYSRKLTRKQTKIVESIQNGKVSKDDNEEIEEMRLTDPLISSQALMISKLSSSHVYKNTDIKYFSSGETFFESMMNDLKEAKTYIFMEYFIIDKGSLWDEILKILVDKVNEGVEVRILYDDIGCMSTVPGNYYRKLKKMGIKAASFSRLRGALNNEFNNRNHRKITIIDGVIAYTGGVNIADEYVNRINRFGNWKDSGVRIKGSSVNEFTRLFLIDYGLSVRKTEEDLKRYLRFDTEDLGSGFCIPYGDGPRPLYSKQVSKTMILNILNQAKNYVYITTPYLIIDSELMKTIENTALRGVDVRIITPHIPDKRLVYLVTRSYYKELINAGVKIYEYKLGFIHSKTYNADGVVGMVGTVNMDYRSLVHHFEDGIWMYNHDSIKDVERDFKETLDESILIEKIMLKQNLFQRLLRSIVKIFSPLL